MVTTVNRETETSAAVAAPVVEPAAAATAVPAVDISAIPESPAELLEQWDTPKRSFMDVIMAALGRFWDATTGPGKTDLERMNRKIDEHQRYFRAQGPHF